MQLFGQRGAVRRSRDLCAAAPSNKRFLFLCFTERRGANVAADVNSRVHCAARDYGIVHRKYELVPASPSSIRPGVVDGGSPISKGIAGWFAHPGRESATERTYEARARSSAGDARPDQCRGSRHPGGHAGTANAPACSMTLAARIATQRRAEGTHVARDRKSTRLNSSHSRASRMPSSA